MKLLSAQNQKSMNVDVLQKTLWIALTTTGGQLPADISEGATRT